MSWRTLSDVFDDIALANQDRLARQQGLYVEGSQRFPELLAVLCCRGGCANPSTLVKT